MRKVTISDIREHNARAGFFFFKRDTMRFFRSRVVSAVYQKGLYFITEEQPPHNKPCYTVRKYDESTGNILTVGEHYAHRTIDAARQAIREYIREEQCQR